MQFVWRGDEDTDGLPGGRPRASAAASVKLMVPGWGRGTTATHQARQIGFPERRRGRARTCVRRTERKRLTVRPFRFFRSSV